MAAREPLAARGESGGATRRGRGAAARREARARRRERAADEGDERAAAFDRAAGWTTPRGIARRGSHDA